MVVVSQNFLRYGWKLQPCLLVLFLTVRSPAHFDVLHVFFRGLFFLISARGLLAG